MARLSLCPAPPPARHRCRRGCGALIYRYTTEIGMTVQIGADPVSVLTDATPAIENWSAWEWRGKWVRWVQLTPGQARGYRPLHVEHECP